MWKWMLNGFCVHACIALSFVSSVIDQCLPLHISQGRFFSSSQALMFPERAMGRPSGSMEKKLTAEEIAAVVGRCQMPDNAVNLLKADAVKLFSKAADDAIPITRRMVKENLWILKELVSESPSHIMHADSKLGCHTAVLSTADITH